MSKNTIKILFFGDLVGRPGRFGVRDYLSQMKSSHMPDFIIANVENASHGFGLTENNYNQLIEYGIDCMTSGNHIWDKKDIFSFIDKADRLIRPYNYPAGVPGIGSRVNDSGIAVINVLGQVFMNPTNSPWQAAVEEIKRLKKITPIVIVDFHAEATAEKICFAKFCSELGVSAFFGTHTHVQTADEQIINNMAYITDAGFCGAKDGIIGMDYQTSITRFTTGLPERYEVADSNIFQINAVEVEIDPKTGYAVAIN
ncbi:MAG: YmdB family metallophosphoesterase, partial [Heliobacteriaceae bacterium]|nr:YmdB family metallophosphoesterase [Heliobacteriaceae bacterium]